MSKSLRLEGLELLRLVGAPVPPWQTVRSVRDVNRLKLPAVDYGWTIRTCGIDGKREVGLFYLNHARKERAIRVLRERLGRPGRLEFYIVYPSWEFQFSCNVLLSDQIYFVEGKYGSQKGLSVGRATPDFALRIPLGMRSKMTCYAGNPGDRVLPWLGKILYWCGRIPKSSFYAEVAVTRVPALTFYELFDV